MDAEQLNGVFTLSVTIVSTAFLTLIFVLPHAPCLFYCWSVFTAHDAVLRMPSLQHTLVAFYRALAARARSNKLTRLRSFYGGVYRKLTLEGGQPVDLSAVLLSMTVVQRTFC